LAGCPFSQLAFLNSRNPELDLAELARQADINRCRELSWAARKLCSFILVPKLPRLPDASRVEP
jgi:hypothetical protein